ncbi:MAG TPA: hypothetical protein DF383_00910, partial [Deltaproteobacteria bacterium]|nr:hypothetical protein [Deltaproteobacteria bacterium]
ALYDKKDYSRARDIFQELYKEDPQNQNALLALGHTYSKLGNFKLAIECFNQINQEPLELN